MNHDDHVRLLRAGVPGPGVWAELGSGTGAFTLALAELLGPGGTIYSVDRDAGALRRQEQAMRARFPGAAARLLPGRCWHDNGLQNFDKPRHTPRGLIEKFLGKIGHNGMTS